MEALIWIFKILDANGRDKDGVISPVLDSREGNSTSAEAAKALSTR
jgi:hypothetical protein